MSLNKKKESIPIKSPLTPVKEGAQPSGTINMSNRSSGPECFNLKSERGLNDIEKESVLNNSIPKHGRGPSIRSVKSPSSMLDNK